MAWCC